MSASYHSLGDSFIIENYNQATPFSSFFPAVAGETGKPMWLFYTNRGQCVASFGIHNKDGAMMEFLPANKAYQATPHLGFRTFISLPGENSWYEPFALQPNNPNQRMIIRPYELELKDVHPKEKIEVTTDLFGVPSEAVPVLGRKLTVKNHSNKPITIQLLDGLPRIVPFGMTDFMVKNMSRTIEAFAEVKNLDAKVPFFKLKIEPSDRPELQWLHSGFFAFFLFDGKLATPIVDPTAVFGSDTSFQRPMPLNLKPNFLNLDQLTSNIMPSAFTFQKMTIPAKGEKSITSYFGFASNLEKATGYADSVIHTEKYFSKKRNEMKNIYSDIVGRFGFRCAQEILNQYADGTFLDNVLRGGYPSTLKGTGKVIHLFARKHGDMERDYNNFQISGTYYSQGNGNFRDINQNRRHDVFLNPQVGELNLEFFFNLMQIDGNNPLVINAVKYRVPKDLLSRSDLHFEERNTEEYKNILLRPVLAGEIYEFISHAAVDVLDVNKVFLDVMKKCEPLIQVQHGEGYWVDHWTYNLDHLAQYLKIYPDKKRWILYEKKDFVFHDSVHFVQPRREKYVITSEGRLRQYKAVVAKSEKQSLIKSRRREPHLLRDQQGEGNVVQTTLFVKLLCLATIKTSSLDPFGMGLEMDADKPGWCDALNGLPGMFGSSTHELSELVRLVRFIRLEAIPLSEHKTIEIPHELFTLIREIEIAFQQMSKNDFRPTWDKLSVAREEFREKTFMGLSGKSKPIRLMELERFFAQVEKVLDEALKKSIDPKTKLPTSFYSYEVNTSKLEDGWRQYLSKLDWKQHRLVPFLEGTVHYLKILNSSKAAQLLKTIRQSELRDKKLGMYKLNGSLENESTEIGRIRVFSPGWLENESIFLHMHYKFLLEILRQGLTDEFLKEAKTGLIPFRSARTYGRPIYENSSFIASSSFPNKLMHGKGFVARLSGATSEFLSMIYYMAFGEKPFDVHDGQVVFSPKPTLPGEWFSPKEHAHLPKNTVKINLLGVPVTYVNSKRKNTYGKGRVKPVSFEWILDGRYHTHEGECLPTDASLALREGRFESLTIQLN